LVQGIEHLKLGVSAIVNDPSYVRQHTHEYPAAHVAGCAIVNRVGTLGGGKEKSPRAPAAYSFLRKASRCMVSGVPELPT
jgi:hypothetical protein